MEQAPLDESDRNVAVARTLGDMIGAWAVAAPNASALAARDKRDMSYRDLALLTDRIALQLRVCAPPRTLRPAASTTTPPRPPNSTPLPPHPARDSAYTRARTTSGASSWGRAPKFGSTVRRVCTD